jgi:hypothetical protein
MFPQELKRKTPKNQLMNILFLWKKSNRRIHSSLFISSYEKIYYTNTINILLFD